MAINQLRELFLFVVVLCLSCCFSGSSSSDERIIQTLEDNIDSENFTYYRLLRDGDLRLELNSLTGDVDIYGSSKNQHPNYHDYEMKSDSCGIDTVLVTEEMQRPVYIAIYGHPSYIHSSFRLNIYSITIPHVETYEDLVAKYESYFFEDGELSKKKEVHRSKSEQRKSTVHVEDDQPLWVKILLGILEFGIDVII